MEIVLTGNSPGELWGWINPLVQTIRKQEPKTTFFLFLLPCAYATGKEETIAREQIGIEQVYPPKTSLKYLFFGKKPDHFSPKNPILIHLGGDLFYAFLLAKKMKTKGYAYQWGEKRWDSAFKEYFVPHQGQKELLIRRKIPEKKIHVTGDLVLDAVELENSRSQSLLIERKNHLISLYPGSRMAELKHILPFYLRVVEITKQNLPDACFYLSLSPFIEDEEIRFVIDKGKKHILESSSGILVENENKKFILTARGAEITVEKGYSYTLMKQSDCILTIPGTKCAEAGLLGTPMLVTLPTNRLEEIPYPGIPYLVEKIPLVGKLSKRLILLNYLPELRFTAQPNILAQELIVPELIGNLTPQMTSDALISLLKNTEKKEWIRKKLKTLYQHFKPGALEIFSRITESKNG
jgi:lipid-A-disaccharide synthase